MRLRDGADIPSLLGAHQLLNLLPESGPRDSFEEVGRWDGGAPLLDLLFERAQFWNIKETSESLDADCRRRRRAGRGESEHPFLAFCQRS